MGTAGFRMEVRIKLWGLTVAPVEPCLEYQRLRSHVLSTAHIHTSLALHIRHKAKVSS